MSEPPAILQIHRETVKPGCEGAYEAHEHEIARTCARLKCPHAYLGIESLTEPKEVWYFNGYGSDAEVKQVESDYTKNAPLMEALERLGSRKPELTRAPVEAFARHQPDVSRGTPWTLGQGRFLAIAVTKREPIADGTVFEVADGTRFIITPARTRDEAEAKAKAAGPDARVFAVRPDWSWPDTGWIASDPEFWKTSSP